MKMDLKRILVPTDFSEASTPALDLAIAFAQRFEAEIILFHAHEMPAYVFPDGVLPVTPEVLGELQRSVMAELDRLAVRIREAGVVVTTRSGIGVHDFEICRAAKESSADLIVMGTHGRTGLRHVLLGSVAEKVVRRAPCPVLTVRPEAYADHPVHP